MGLLHLSAILLQVLGRLAVSWRLIGWSIADRSATVVCMQRGTVTASEVMLTAERRA